MRSKILEGTLRTKNYSEIIIERVVSSILSEEIRPGDKLPTEEEFAARIGVGRNSVREAMNILKAFGIVEVRRSAGTFIAEDFHGAMLNPLVYGILLKKHHSSDMAELKVWMQEMVILLLLEKECSDELDQYRKEIYAYRPVEDDSIIEQKEYLEGFEIRLGGLIGNPLIGQIFSEIVKLCSCIQTRAIMRKVETGNALWFLIFYRDMLDAMQKRDKKKIHFLIQSEQQALLSAISTN